MTDHSAMRGLPQGAFYVTLGLMFLTWRLLLVVLTPLPLPFQAAGGAMWGALIHWSIAAVSLRSDPRVWRSGTRWHRANILPLKPALQAAAAAGVKALVAPRLRRESSLLAAIGAAVIVAERSVGIMVLSGLMAYAAVWWIGYLLDLGSVAGGPDRAPYAEEMTDEQA